MSQEYRSIKMPGSLLDQIKDKEDKGDYDSDKRYRADKKKRKQLKELGRKEKRKEERKLKKQKRSHGSQVPSKPKHKSSAGVSQDVEEEDNNGDEEMDEDDTWTALKALKEKKNTKAHSEIDLNESEEDFLGFSEAEDDQPQSVEDTMAALKALKMKKNKTNDKGKLKEKLKIDSVEDTMAALKAMKLKKKSSQKDNNKNLTADETMAALKALKGKKAEKLSSKKLKQKSKTLNIKTALMREDEAQMEYYAKKLGMSKKDKLQDIGDGLDSILDGLDFDLESEKEASESEEDITQKYSDDEINSSDFDDDDDLDSDELLEMELMNDSASDSNESETESLDDEEEGLSDLEEEDEEEEEEPRKEKENPYVAPVVDSGRYIPPALRRKMMEESSLDNNESEETKKLKKSINSSLNKLSEANFVSIISNELNLLYHDNPRQTVTENLTNFLLNNIKSSSRLLDSFVIVYAGVVSAFYRLQGIEFAAFFIQRFIETLESYTKGTTGSNGKELINLITLFGFVYNLNVFSSNLTFDIIKILCTDITEAKIEVLLKLTLISGQRMRQEDPASLKEIIALASKSINDEKSFLSNSRAKFLLETLQNVKNNKFRNSDQTENNQKVITSLKKQLQNLTKISADPIQVTLDDIHNIETKGKWWLVGAAWKGHDGNSNIKKVEVNEDIMNDILDTAEPNWNELADFYRMNTSVRKAIFIAIMSSESFEEAATKVQKLGLRGNQKYEVPKILLICCSIEPHYNPFYGHVAKQFCTDHDMRKTFQFNLWDLIKEFEGLENDDSDSDDEGTSLGRLASKSLSGGTEESHLKKILSLGKLYGFLIGQNSLPLTVLKTVNFVTASEDTKMFLEILLVTFLDNVGKLAEISAFGTGSKKSKILDLKFDEKKLLEKIPTSQPVLLRGLQYFIQQNVRASDFISGRRQTKRVEWGCDTLCDVIDEFLNNTHQD